MHIYAQLHLEDLTRRFDFLTSVLMMPYDIMTAEDTLPRGVRQASNLGMSCSAVQYCR